MPTAASATTRTISAWRARGRGVGSIRVYMIGQGVVRRMKTFSSAVVALVLAALTPAALFAQADIEPARFVDGSIPRMPPLAASGGDVMLSVAVSTSGVVGAV